MRRLSYLPAIAGLVLALAIFFASGCNPAPKQSAATQQPATTAGNGTAADNGAGAAADATSGDAAQDGGDSATADANGATTDNSADGGGGDNNSGGESTKYYDEIKTTISFLKAEHNPKKDATMSVLRFAFDSWVARGKELSTEVEMSDIYQVVKAELDLKQAKLEIYPVISKPYIYQEGPVGEQGYKYDGSYQVHVYLPDGEEAGLFAVSADGDFLTAPPDQQVKGFSVRSRHRVEDYGPRRYQVYRTVKEGGSTKVLFTIWYDGGGFQNQEVLDSAGNLYKYRFPEGQIVIHFGEGGLPERSQTRDPEKERQEKK